MKRTTKRVRTLALILALVLATTVLSGAAFAQNPKSVSDTAQSEGIARVPDYVYCTKRTEVWEKAPYSVITNSIVFYAEVGYKFNLKGLYTDPHGGMWYYVTAISGPFPGAYGYISLSASENIVG